MKRFFRHIFLWGFFILCLLPDGKSSTECGGAFIEQAEALYRSRDYVAAAEYYNLELTNTQIRACSTYLYYRLGRTNTRLSLFHNAVEAFQTALDLSRENSNPKVKGKILSAMAEVYSKTGEFENAYLREIEALNIAMSLTDTGGISRSQYQLGSYAFSLGRFEEALDHYLAVEQLLPTDTVGAQHATIWGAIGLVYLELGNSKAAISHLEASVKYARDFKWEETLAYTMGNLARAYQKEGEFEAAENYFHESLLKLKQLDDATGLIAGKLDYGTFLTDLHRYYEAEKQLKEAVKLADAISAKSKLVTGYDALTSLYKQTKDFEQALWFKEAATELKDDIINEQTLSRIEHIQSQYEIERNELEISRLHLIQEQEETNYNLKKKTVFMVFSFMFLIFLYGLYMNNKLQKQNAKLEDSRRSLVLKNEELKNFAYVASHDLKEPLRTINSFAGLLRRRYGQDLDTRALEYMDYISAGVHRMTDLLDDLLDYARIDHTEEGKQLVDSGDLIRSVIGQLDAQIEEQQAEVLLISDEFPAVEVIPSQFSQLLQNLLTNAIKFSNGHTPIVKIQCDTVGRNMLRFSVQDNGIGIAPEHREKIFKMFTRLHSREDYEGTGIGLATCRKIVEKCGGEIWVESTPGQGATFYFTIPAQQLEAEIL